ncbi:MAG: S9 family peptidase [Chloroflexi bacterium]|nr:S9 family peptidase [Chloroflexota bacterium]
MSKSNLRTIKPEDLFRFRFLQDAKLSPDGRNIAYCISHIDEEKDEEYTTIWLLSLETGEAHKLTTGLAQDSHPDWSPDGSQLAFFSNRTGARQLYVLSIDGGRPVQLTDLPQGLGRGPAWSPDGQYIAFSARVTAEPVYPTKPYRVTRTVYRMDGLGYLHTAAHDLFIVPASGGDVRNLTQDEAHNCYRTGPVWSPDSQKILFTTACYPDSYRWFASLRVANLNGNVRDLVKDWGHVTNPPSAGWTPDGKRVVFLGNPIEAPKQNHKHLWVVDSEGSTPECRTTGITHNVAGKFHFDMPIIARDAPNLHISADGQNAYVPVQNGGKKSVYRIGLTGEIDYEAVVTGDRACDVAGLHGEKILMSITTFNDPGNLFLVNQDGSDERQVTTFNQALMAEFVLPKVENLTYTSSDGTTLEGWLMRPTSGNPPYPTILYNHGGPDMAWGNAFSLDFQMLVGAGYAVLLINYRGSLGYGSAFMADINGRMGELEFADLMAGVDHCIELGLADPDRLGICGSSYGGYLTCWAIGHTDRFKAAVPENPITNWESWYGVADIFSSLALPFEAMGGHPHETLEAYRNASPISFAHRCITPTLLIQAERDLRCPAEQSEQFYTVLKANGCIVEMLRLPNSSHGGSTVGSLETRRAQNEALLDWMNRFVHVEQSITK